MRTFLFTLLYVVNDVRESTVVYMYGWEGDASGGNAWQVYKASCCVYESLTLTYIYRLPGPECEVEGGGRGGVEFEKVVEGIRKLEQII